MKKYSHEARKRSSRSSGSWPPTRFLHASDLSDRAPHIPPLVGPSRRFGARATMPKPKSGEEAKVPLQAVVLADSFTQVRIGVELTLQIHHVNTQSAFLVRDRLACD